MCGILTKEPFNKSFAEIGDMTPIQVRHVLFRKNPEDAVEEEEDGWQQLARLSGEGAAATAKVNYETIFRTHAKNCGLSSDEIEAQWAAYVKDHPDCART